MLLPKCQQQWLIVGRGFSNQSTIESTWKCSKMRDIRILSSISLAVPAAQRTLHKQSTREWAWKCAKIWSTAKKCSISISLAGAQRSHKVLGVVQMALGEAKMWEISISIRLLSWSVKNYCDLWFTKKAERRDNSQRKRCSLIRVVAGAWWGFKGRLRRVGLWRRLDNYTSPPAQANTSACEGGGCAAVPYGPPSTPTPSP